MAAFGLPDQTLATIRGILAEYPEVEVATIYGSRAMGTHRPGSDIDLTLIGVRLTERHLSEIAGRLDESDIPYLVDLSLRQSIQNPNLLAHIDRVGAAFYTR